MRKYRFKQSNSDHTLFIKHKVGKVTVLIVYVDDMIITGNDEEEITRLQKELATEFEMKNLGGLKYFLGIEVARLGEYSDQASTDKGRYQRLVGKLIYLSHTRPDIAYAVNIVSQFMHNPSEDHMDATGPEISQTEDLLQVIFMFFDRNLVIWRSKKQKVVALSSTEIEFRGMTKWVCELLWIKRLLTKLGFAFASEMDLFCDNKAAIAISQDPVQHDRTKHVEVDQHFIRKT
ncbi:Retrovirus-related Pol polyprotein from transposon RE1 [Vitis vinifera]|uniref:Retrovirus-related Pol polyprotein from transposon RE1 n=1 Tax=Vitis vinifera TaxID=29760 RepID=A0A438E387_VITVI|nr:Retrovirus-related Pol polyprotein from transposon RE1 [Vitis vinifera]